MAAFISSTQNNFLTNSWSANALQPLTVMFWGKIPTGSPATFRDFVALNPNVFIQTGSNGRTLTIGTSDANFGTVRLGLNDWYHVAVTINPVTVSDVLFNLYVNGNINISEAEDTGVTFSNYTSLSIGNNPSLSNVLNGAVRDVRVWSRILSLVDVRREKRSPIPNNRSGLLMWYPLDTNLTNDSSGNGLTLSFSTVGATNITLRSGQLIPYNKSIIIK